MRQAWISLLAFGVLAFAVMVPQSVRAAELLMIEEDWCHWCERWHAEIGIVYDKTQEGQRAPLRKIDIHSKELDRLDLKMRPQYTPTFVLLHEGKEISRLEGYPGEDFFWGILGQMLDKLPGEGE